jgi:hypothetical protein
MSKLGDEITAELRKTAIDYAMGRLDERGIVNADALVIAHDFGEFSLNRPATSSIREDWGAYHSLLTGDLP